jgi:hypothetical protein
MLLLPVKPNLMHPKSLQHKITHASQPPTPGRPDAQDVREKQESSANHSGKNPLHNGAERSDINQTRRTCKAAAVKLREGGKPIPEFFPEYLEDCRF